MMKTGPIEALTFVTVAIAVAAIASVAYDFFLNRRVRIRARLAGHFGQSGQSQLPREELFKNFSRLTTEAARPLPGLWHRFQDMLVQSGLPISMRSFATATISAIALTTFSGWLLGGLWGGFVGACTGGAAPFAYLRARCERRQRVLCGQLPEALELMARAVRAGQTVSGAFQIVARDLDPPLADEFAFCYEQQNLGRPPERALRDLARRTGVIELQMLVAALLVQRRSGGNIVELLGNLSSIVRKRLRLAGKVRALTSEGRLQALVLVLLPIAVFLGLLVLNRPYVQVLLDRPHILGTLAGLQVVGGIWIHKIIRVDY